MISATVDLGGLLSLLDLRSTLRREAAAAARDLTAMAHAHAVDLASRKLHSRRKLFVDALSMTQIGDGSWYLQLDGRARWIDDGMPPHDMLPDLLRSPKAKVARDGSRYLVVPMRHGPAQNAPASQQPMIDAVRAEMKRRNIPWGKIERGADGKALTGRLHAFNIADKPLKTGHGPGQGWGPTGDVRQGPNARQAAGGGPGGGGTPFLKGVSVYQRELPGGGVRRDVMTFRVASSKHQGQGRWRHPGLDPVNILDDTLRWVIETWEKEVMPALLDRVIAAL